MKKLVVIFAGLMTLGSVYAAPLSPAEALARAKGDLPRRVAGKNFVATPVYTVKTGSDVAAAYVFSAENSNGFTILSADDTAYPVLGYSDSGTFDVNNIPSNMQWWLSECARQIEWASNQGYPIAKAPLAPEGWTAITPLVKTTWDQSEPYNNECPTKKNDTKHAYTGCVATSMAQAMKYFNYPEKGEGFIEYYVPQLGVRVAVNLADINLDWKNMLDNYAYGSYNDTQAKAVADLMVACGYSVQMSYGLDASGATGSTIGSALRKYFNYDSNCHSEFRLLYSMSEWTEKVYNNLKNIGPVIINGHDPGAMGHSFVCDGYDGNGYFHFNWGWSGVSDGYYSLDALNPDAMGIGGYGSGFNFGQNAIFGIQPSTGKTSEYKLNITQLGNTVGSIEGSTIYCGTSDYDTGGYVNYCDETIKGRFGLAFARVSSDQKPEIVVANIGKSETVSLQPGYYYGASSRVNCELPALDNGEYKVTLMFRPDGDDWKEVLVPWGYNNFVYLTKSESGVTVTKPEQKTLKIVKAEVASKFYYESPTLIKLTVENPSDVELTQGIIPSLIDGSRVAMQGSNALITVGAKQTAEIDFVANFTPVNGYGFSSPTDFVLNLSNPETNVSYGDFGTYTMENSASTFSLTLKKLEVANAEEVSLTYAGTGCSAYVVNNASDFDINFNYAVRAGYFAGLVKLGILKVDPDNFSRWIPVTSVDQIFQQTAFMDRGDSSENVVTAHFPDAEEGVLYVIVCEYSKAQSWVKLGRPTYFVIKGTGVDDIIGDADANVEYYSLQGFKVTNPKAGQILIRRSGNKVGKVVIR